jgi:uncharacterized RDD family membrane protein YckC
MEEPNNSIGIIVHGFFKVANSNSRIHRISSMLLDHLILTFLIVPPAIITTIIGQQIDLEIGSKTNATMFLSMLFIYLNKDFWKGKSPAKRILGYQIIDKKTERAASELQCFIRNLTICVAWPLEVIVTLINPKRRIGDFIANTKVISSQKEKLKTILIDARNTKLKTNFIGILLIAGVYFYGLSFIL